VLPKVLVALVVALHVLAHVGDEAALAVVLQQGGDVGVGAGRVAALRVGAVAVVGPEAVDGPRVCGAWEMGKVSVLLSHSLSLSLSLSL
jgi:hypothetical protein